MEEAVTFFFRAIEADPAAYAPCSIGASALRVLGRETEAARLTQLARARIQRRLLRYPDDQRAIYLGAVALAREGSADEALEWARRAEVLDPEEPVALYNLACVACSCHDVENGLRYLRSAIRHGYPHLSWIENDADLAALRADSRFEEIVAPLKEGTHA